MAKVGKLYGSPNFGSGPKRGEGNAAIAKGNNSKGSFNDGTKAAMKGEDKAGKASGKRGNVKA